MGKKYVVYANGKDLAELPVTQNENGKYYRNSAKKYFTPKLADFDNVKLPVGYKMYTDGSHARHINNPNRNPIDISLVAGTVITMNVDVNVVGINSTEDWIKVTPVGSNYKIVFVHTYQFSKGLVKAGNAICKVAPKSVTGYDPHLHIDEWSNRGLKIRDLILNGDFNMVTFKIGDKIKFIGVQNIRSGSGTEYKILRDSVVGEVATIKDGPRESDNYTWYDCIFNNGSTGWVADVKKFVLDNTPVQDPVIPPEQTECEKEVERLKTENKGLTNELTALKSQVEKLENELKLQKDRVAFLEGSLKERDEEIKELESSFDTLKKEKDRLEKEKLEIQEQFDKYKQENNSSFVNPFVKVFDKIIDFIKRKVVK